MLVCSTARADDRWRQYQTQHATVMGDASVLFGVSWNVINGDRFSLASTRYVDPYAPAQPYDSTDDRKRTPLAFPSLRIISTNFA